MAFPNKSLPDGRLAPSAERVIGSPSELDDEVRRALGELESGDYLELTPEALQHCIATGDSPWPDDSSG